MATAQMKERSVGFTRIKKSTHGMFGCWGFGGEGARDGGWCQCIHRRIISIIYDTPAKSLPFSSISQSQLYVLGELLVPATSLPFVSIPTRKGYIVISPHGRAHMHCHPRANLYRWVLTDSAVTPCCKASWIVTRRLEHSSDRRNTVSAVASLFLLTTFCRRQIPKLEPPLLALSIPFHTTASCLSISFGMY